MGNMDSLTDQDKAVLHRINKAFGGMPYVGLATFITVRGPHFSLTLEEIAINLERLRDGLQRVAARDRETLRELQEWRDHFRDVKDINAFVEKMLASAERTERK